MHVIEAGPENIHGRFSATRKPVLTVASGDVVSFRNLPDVTWGLSQHGFDGTRGFIEGRDIGPEGGPGMCGPVAVEGLRPGMVLEVEFQKIEPCDWGWTWLGSGGFVRGWFEGIGLGGQPGRIVRWTIDAEARVATSESGHRVRIAPFLGTVGLSPGGEGEHPGWFPGRTAGNLDCTLLTEGSVLYIPVEAEGGLFSLGDGHAAQGDGEVAGSAIECRMARVDVRLTARPDLSFAAPRVKMPSAWATLGTDRALEKAAAMAMGEMLDLMEARFGVDRVEALALASAVVDVRVTQLVNGVCGVHAVLRDDAISSG